MTFDGPDSDALHAAGGPPLPDPIPPQPRMGWRSFVPLAAGGAVALVLLWYGPGRSSVDLDDWSLRIARSGGGEALALPPASAVRLPPEELEERAGIRWVGIRIALLAGRAAEADSLLGVLAGELGDRAENQEAVRHVVGLEGAELELDRGRVERAQGSLADALGPGFEEAVVLESLRRAARTGLSDLASYLVNHPLLSDGVDEDLEPQVARRLHELGDGPPSAEELAEIEEIVSGILRRRAG